MSIETDFHSHILPGIDDGSRHLEQSLKMLQAEAAQGIKRVVATPHFYPANDRLERFLARREMAEERLREAMDQHGNLPELYVGAEVHYFPNISDCEELPQMTVAGSRYLLVEMPGTPWSEEMWRQLEGIHAKQGLTPIIAHVDRYVGRFRNRQLPSRLAQLPVLVQANGEFFTQKSTAAMALTMLREGKIHLLGSDCHDLGKRCPNLGSAVEVIRKKVGEDAMSHIKFYEQKVLGI